MFRRDPGPCPVDDTPHTACTAPVATVLSAPLGGPIGEGNRVIVPLPDSIVPAPILRAEAIQATLPPGQFTTGTYRRKRRP